MSLMCLLLKPLFLQVLGVTGQTKKNKPKDVRAPPTRQKMMTKSVKASTTWNPPLRSKEEESKDEEEEDVATHLGGAEPFIGHFTMANLSSKKDN